MLFDRRHKPSISVRTRDLFWPRIGWSRATKYLAHRVRRIPGTPYAIAAGFACGAAISMTPFPGFHFILAAILAWIIGGSILAAAIGTAVGNPWTFPFIWIWIYQLGGWILGTGDALAERTITLGYLLDHPMDVFLPMLVGSIPTASLIWIIFFLPLRRMVESYQVHRRARLERRTIANTGAGGAE